VEERHFSAAHIVDPIKTRPGKGRFSAALPAPSVIARKTKQIPQD
jgi:hypothetical protein